MLEGRAASVTNGSSAFVVSARIGATTHFAPRGNGCNDPSRRSGATSAECEDHRHDDLELLRAIHHVRALTMPFSNAYAVAPARDETPILVKMFDR